jgi:hypothetical protein
MQDGIITTESSHGWIGSVGRAPAGYHSRLGTGVHTLQSCSTIAIAASSVMDEPSGLSVLMFWDFYLPPVVESVVSRGCSRGEESGSLYLADPIAIIEVRGEEVLASTLDGGRLWRRDPG